MSTHNEPTAEDVEVARAAYHAVFPGVNKAGREGMRAALLADRARRPSTPAVAQATDALAVMARRMGSAEAVTAYTETWGRVKRESGNGVIAVHAGLAAVSRVVFGEVKAGEPDAFQHEAMEAVQSWRIRAEKAEAEVYSLGHTIRETRGGWEESRGYVIALRKERDEARAERDAATKRAEKAEAALAQMTAGSVVITRDYDACQERCADLEEELARANDAYALVRPAPAAAARVDVACPVKPEWVEGWAKGEIETTGVVDDMHCRVDVATDSEIEAHAITLAWLVREVAAMREDGR